jgi:hypothetical protein
MWVVARAALALVGMVDLSPVGTAGIVLAVVVLTWIELRVSRERLLYANLAVSPRLVTVVAAVVVLSLEVVAASVLGLFVSGLSPGLIP